MKKLSFIVCGLSALVMASCAGDESRTPDIPAGSDGDVFATLNLRLPAVTRADGDGADTPKNNGIEIGQDAENSVGRILVVLATKNANGQYCFLTKSYSDARPNTGGDIPVNTLKYTMNFKASEMTPNPMDQSGEGSEIPGTQVYVFAYCNPTASTEANWANVKKGDVIDNYSGQITHKDDALIWQNDHFLMTNCEISEAVTIPSRATLVANNNVPEKAFNLGTVKVKRACARFDFATTNDNVYDIKDEVEDKVMGQVELTDMALFNIQKEFFYLPHVSSSWTWNTPAIAGNVPNYNLCGDLDGFVMSAGGTFKTASTLNLSTVRNNFYSTIIDNRLAGGIGDQDLKWTSIRPSDWNKRTEDINEGNTWSPDNADYRIWRYTTENTIPALDGTKPTNSQRQGITTGVVFKGEFSPADKDVWNGHVIYMHNNIVFGDLKALKEYVEKYPDTQIAKDFNNVESLKNGNPETDLDKNLMIGLEGEQRHNFKAYAPTNGKYVVYYFYYNRHISNGNNSLMGNNEFGVVRNNVYKLRVNTIGRLGEPKAPNNPDNPDEEENAYFSVSCLVMPWSVRVNQIDF